MIQQILQKTGLLLISVFTVLSICFCLTQLLPGNPFLDDLTIPEEVLQALSSKHDLNRPLWNKYYVFLEKLCQGDLGTSFVYNKKDVLQMIFQALPISAALGFVAILIAILIGGTLGCLCAVKRCNLTIVCKHYFSLIVCLPSFVISILLQYFFCIYFRFLPLLYNQDLVSMILPIICLSISPSAIIFKLVYRSVTSVLNQDYILVAKAKGLSTYKIVTSHVLKNVILTTFSYVIPILSSILTGSIVVERIFAIPGVGSLLITSVQNRDFPVVYAQVIILSFIFLSLATLSDFINQFLNPQKS